MAILSEAVQSLHVQVSTPNEQLFGEARGRYDVSIRIMPGYAERAGEQELEAQLQRLARLLFAHRSAAYAEIKDAVLQPSTRQRPASPEQEAYQREYDALAVSGASRDGSVRVTALGLSSWVVDVERGAVERLGSEGLSRAATEAAGDLVTNVVGEVRDLRRQHLTGRRTA